MQFATHAWQGSFQNTHATGQSWEGGCEGCVAGAVACPGVGEGGLASPVSQQVQRAQLAATCTPQLCAWRQPRWVRTSQPCRPPANPGCGPPQQPGSKLQRGRPLACSLLFCCSRSATSFLSSATSSPPRPCAAPAAPAGAVAGAEAPPALSTMRVYSDCSPLTCRGKGGGQWLGMLEAASGEGWLR